MTLPDTVCQKVFFEIFPTYYYSKLEKIFMFNERLEEKNEKVEENLMPEGGAVTLGKNGGIHCLNIIGQIEGHYVLGESQKTTKYEHVIPLLVAIEESPDCEGLLVILNTMGGDVEAGLALAELIASMKKPVVTLVLGGGHSIGVPMAVAGKRSFIVPSATMTLHPVRISGTVIGAPQTYRYFKEMQERIADFVCRNSHMSREAFLSCVLKPDEMAADVGSILDGQEAVESGLIDEVGGLHAALECVKELIRREKPNPS